MRVCVKRKTLYPVLEVTVVRSVRYASTQQLQTWTRSRFDICHVHQRILASVATIIKIVSVTSSVSKYNHKCQLMHFEIQSRQSALWNFIRLECKVWPDGSTKGEYLYN